MPGESLPGRKEPDELDDGDDAELEAAAVADPAEHRVCPGLPSHPGQ